jgi:NitT/TauT family transport system permease protein
MNPAPTHRLLRLTAPIATALFVLALWQWAVRAYAVPIYLVPAPTDIARALVLDAPLLLPALITTLRITLLALAAAVVCGVAIAVLFAQSRVLEASLFPYAVVLQVTPIVAIAPLIIIWVQDTTAALTLCATIVAIFPVISSTAIGLRSVDPGLLDLFRLQRASRWQVLTRLRVPSALPSFFGGLRIAAGLALIGAVVAEFVAGTGGSRSGLAYELLQAGYQLNVPRVFAALALITAVGILLYAATTLAARWALRHWHESELAE